MTSSTVLATKYSAGASPHLIFASSVPRRSSVHRPALVSTTKQSHSPSSVATRTAQSGLQGRSGVEKRQTIVTLKNAAPSGRAESRSAASARISRTRRYLLAEVERALRSPRLARWVNADPVGGAMG